MLGPCSQLYIYTYVHMLSREGVYFNEAVQFVSRVCIQCVFVKPKRHLVRTVFAIPRLKYFAKFLGLLMES